MMIKHYEADKARREITQHHQARLASFESLPAWLTAVLAALIALSGLMIVSLRMSESGTMTVIYFAVLAWLGLIILVGADARKRSRIIARDHFMHHLRLFGTPPELNLIGRFL
jgi:small-conductance mechanosensitive channel